MTSRASQELVQLVWQLKTACLTRRFGVLVVGNQMDSNSSYTFDRQKCGQIFNYVCFFGYCSHGLVTVYHN